MLAVYIGTNNDTNGNPRRGWIIYKDDGAALTFIDEGYGGREEIRKYEKAIGRSLHIPDTGSAAALSILPDTGLIAVTPGEYRRWVKFAKLMGGKVDSDE